MCYICIYIYIHTYIIIHIYIYTYIHVYIYPYIYIYIYIYTHAYIHKHIIHIYIYIYIWIYIYIYIYIYVCENDKRGPWLHSGSRSCSPPTDSVLLKLTSQCASLSWGAFSPTDTMTPSTTSVCEQKHSSGEKLMWKQKLSECKMRGWRAASAADLQGKGWPKRRVRFTDTSIILCHAISRAQQRGAKSKGKPLKGSPPVFIDFHWFLFWVFSLCSCCFHGHRYDHAPAVRIRSKPSTFGQHQGASGPTRKWWWWWWWYKLARWTIISTTYNSEYWFKRTTNYRVQAHNNLLREFMKRRLLKR